MHHPIRSSPYSQLQPEDCVTIACLRPQNNSAHLQRHAAGGNRSLGAVGAVVGVEGLGTVAKAEVAKT